MKSKIRITHLHSLLLAALLLLATAANPLHAEGTSDPARQVIELQQGWNLIALTVTPGDASFAAVFAPIKEHVVMVRDQIGRMWIPDFGFGEISSWDAKQAYHVFVRETVTLNVPGTPIETGSLIQELEQGWNTLPYVGRPKVTARSFFGQKSDIVLVRDNAGRTYWPEHDIDEIGELVSGQGYQVFATSSVTIEPPAERPVYRVPASIDATGRADVTADLNEFFNSVPDGSLILLGEAAEYKVEGTLRLITRHDLILDGNGAIVFADDPRPEQYAGRSTYPWRNRYHLSLEGGSQIEVRNLRIRGAHPNGGVDASAYVISLEAQHGINIYSTKGVRIDNCIITDVFGDFVYVGYQRGGWAEDIEISNSQMERNGRQGIAITGGRHVRILNNRITEVRRSVFDLEANTSSGGAEFINIIGNQIGTKRLTWLANQGRGSRIRHIVIEDNVTDSEMDIQVRTPEGDRRGPFRVANNVGSRRYGSPSGALMIFDRVDGLEVVGNTHPLQDGRNMYGVRLTDVTDYEIVGNVLANSAGQFFIREE